MVSIIIFKHCQLFRVTYFYILKCRLVCYIIELTRVRSEMQLDLFYKFSFINSYDLYTKLRAIQIHLELRTRWNIVGFDQTLKLTGL